MSNFDGMLLLLLLLGGCTFLVSNGIFDVDGIADNNDGKGSPVFEYKSDRKVSYRVSFVFVFTYLESFCY